MSILSFIWPDIVVRDLTFVPDAMAQLRASALILDLDQTILAHDDETPTDEIVHTIDQLRRNHNCCILSNRSFRADEISKLNRLSEFFQIPYVMPPSRKPSRSAFGAALQCLNTSPCDTAMVGDRIWSDVIGANRCGLRTILVEPNCWHNEPLFTSSLPRYFEMWAILSYERFSKKKHGSISAYRLPSIFDILSQHLHR